jgi:hypothetical protein
MSEVQMKIRAYELEPNDFFIKQNMTYRVMRIQNGMIYAKHPLNSTPITFGAKSMEFVLWTGKYSGQIRVRSSKKSKIPKFRSPMVAVRVFSEKGEKLGEYKSIRKAADSVGIDYKYIVRYLNKELVKKKYPYHFEKIIQQVS